MPTVIRHPLEHCNQTVRVRNHDAELTCSFIAKIPDTSSSSSDPSSAPTLPQTNSTIFGSFDYLKPLPLAADCSPDQLEVFKQGFKTWFGMVCGGPENINREKGFMFASMLRSLDTEWQTYVRQKANIESCTMEEIFKVLEKQMMITKPMSVRRSSSSRSSNTTGRMPPPS